jgi:hypothetical protein
MDKVQVLNYSRAPDLWRGVILLAVIVLAALLYGVRRRWLDGRDRAVLFNAALALTVLVVFNQQIITGVRSNRCTTNSTSATTSRCWRHQSPPGCSGTGARNTTGRLFRVRRRMRRSLLGLSCLIASGCLSRSPRFYGARARR